MARLYISFQLLFHVTHAVAVAVEMCEGWGGIALHGAIMTQWRPRRLASRMLSKAAIKDMCVRANFLLAFVIKPKAFFFVEEAIGPDWHHLFAQSFWGAQNNYSNLPCQGGRIRDDWEICPQVGRDLLANFLYKKRDPLRLQQQFTLCCLVQSLLVVHRSHPCCCHCGLRRRRRRAERPAPTPRCMFESILCRSPFFGRVPRCLSTFIHG